jgi:hypothetical protein
VARRPFPDRLHLVKKRVIGSVLQRQQFRCRSAKRRKGMTGFPSPIDDPAAIGCESDQIDIVLPVDLTDNMERLLLGDAVALPVHHAGLGFLRQERRLLYRLSRLGKRSEPLDDEPDRAVNAGTIFRGPMTCQFCQLQQPLQVGMRDNGIIFHAHSTVRQHEHQRAEIDLDQSA